MKLEKCLARRLCEASGLVTRSVSRGSQEREWQFHNMVIRCLLCESICEPVAVGNLSSKVGASGVSRQSLHKELEVKNYE